MVYLSGRSYRRWTVNADNVIYPLETIKLYGGIYKQLFAKAKNVELRCYEDPDFYDKYTMAIDGAEEKICAIVKRFWGLLASIPAVGTVFYLMYDIDHYAVLFIISPLIGNFIFGNYKRKYEYKRYQAQVPGNKVHNYVSRMMYLPDGAKEMRLSNVFSLLRKQYKEATEKNVRAAVKYAFANCSLSFWRITFTFTIIFEGVLFYASYRNLVSKTITLAQLTIMTSLMVAMTWILIMAFEDIMELMKNGVFINNLRTFLEYEEQIPQDQSGVMPEGFESLEFRNVCFSYKDEETIKDPAMIETLTSALDGSKDTFISLCQNLESQTNISGIQLVVEYTYGDEVLSSKTYTAEG